MPADKGKTESEDKKKAGGDKDKKESEDKKKAGGDKGKTESEDNKKAGGDKGKTESEDKKKAGGDKGKTESEDKKKAGGDKEKTESDDKKKAGGDKEDSSKKTDEKKAEKPDTKGSKDDALKVKSEEEGITKKGENKSPSKVEDKKDGKSEDVKGKDGEKPEPKKEAEEIKPKQDESKEKSKQEDKPTKEDGKAIDNKTTKEEGTKDAEKNGTPVPTEEGKKTADDVKESSGKVKEVEQVNTTAADGPEATEETPLRGIRNRFQGVNARLVFAVSAAAFGSAFQHGYNLGVINAPLEIMGDWLNMTSYNRSEEYLTETGKTMIISWIVSIYCIGGMIGGAFTGFFSERFGRKGGLLINNAFALLAAIFFGFCKLAASWEMIILGRFIIGINNGLNAGLAPMYLSEIAPTSVRGAIGTVYQLVVTISILFSQIMGLSGLLGTEELWPLLLALTAAPAIFQLCTLPICPESPKFLLINKEQKLEGQRALTWLRDSTNVEDEMEEIQNEAEAQKLVPKVSVREICSNPALRIPLIIALMMMMAQQLSGINAAIFFSVKIYEAAGLSDTESLYATIAMGTMNVLMTVVSLVLVEKAGRKTLMIIGLSGMMVDTILLTLCLALQSESARWLSYASILLVILFVVMFATGPGSIPWFIVNELFASNARPTACSIAVAVNWTAAFVVGVGFLPIQQALGPFVFLVFTFLLALFIAFVAKKVPETRGKSIDEITAVFKQQAYGGGANRV